VTDLDSAVWPMSVGRTPEGVLAIGGTDARALAAEYGTPAWVVDEEDFRARAAAFREEFTAAFAPLGVAVDVYYAGKAFLCTAVARWVSEEGLGIDTCSAGELAVAIQAGVPGARIGIHGNNKSDGEIGLALDYGVGRIVLDSTAEIGRVADAAAERGIRAPVMLRITTGVHAGGHEFVATAHEDQKFGVSIAGDQALAALQNILARPELELLGIHCHIGSQIQDVAAFEATARRMLELRAALAAATGVLVPEVDLGGGYGISYLPGERALPISVAAQAIAETVGAVCQELGTPVPRISIEPGRAIAGASTFTLYRVGVVKPVTLEDGTVRTYVSVDGGMSDNPRPMMYGAEYTAVIADRVSRAAPVRCRIVGKHCETGDIVIRDIELPGDVAPGDLLAVPGTGAYGRSMASNYNLVPRPPVVAVRGDASRVIVRRETVADLLALDVG
jgi:diaminopimelate decarboxylase